MGIRIIGVGVTSQVNITLMMEIVTNRNTDYFPVVAFDDLAQILEIIIQEVIFYMLTLRVYKDVFCPFDIVVLSKKAFISGINFQGQST